MTPYNGLANRRLKPLGHLSRLRRYYSVSAGRIKPKREESAAPAAGAAA